MLFWQATNVQNFRAFTVVKSLKLSACLIKCSKISNSFYFLFSNKMLVFRVANHKMLVRIANREDSDQTASSEAVRSGSVLLVC